MFQRYQERKMKDAIGMLKALIKKLENGKFVLDEHGWWPTNVGNRIIFRVIVISKDSEQDSRTFEQK